MKINVLGDINAIRTISPRERRFTLGKPIE